MFCVQGIHFASNFGQPHRCLPWIDDPRHCASGYSSSRTMALRRPAAAPPAVLRRWVRARPAGGAAAVAGHHRAASRGEARDRRRESDVRTLPEVDWYDVLRNPTLRARQSRAHSGAWQPRGAGSPRRRQRHARPDDGRDHRPALHRG